MCIASQNPRCFTTNSPGSALSSPAWDAKASIAIGINESRENNRPFYFIFFPRTISARLSCPFRKTQAFDSCQYFFKQAAENSNWLAIRTNKLYFTGTTSRFLQGTNRLPLSTFFSGHNICMNFSWLHGHQI